MTMEYVMLGGVNDRPELRTSNDFCMAYRFGQSHSLNLSGPGLIDQKRLLSAIFSKP